MPAYTQAWSTLLSTFPGRVLMVSNSAGSAKDRGGIGAEALSMSLTVPVLAHRQPKPACGEDILAYFSGRLGPPRLTRDRQNGTAALAEVEEEVAEAELLEKWRWRVEEGPLCGNLIGSSASGKGGYKSTLEERMVAAQYKVPPPGAEGDSAVQAALKTKSRAAAKEEKAEEIEEIEEDEITGNAPVPGTARGAAADKSALRVLVVGDRLFTDVLLARRLEKYGVRALAVQTTALPMPNDVRLLRRFEEWLSGRAMSPQAPMWARYVIEDAPKPAPTAVPRGLERLNPLVQAQAAWERWTAGTPAVQLDPRSGTWKPKPIFVAAMRAAGRGLRVLSHYARLGGKWSWVRIRAGVRAGLARGKAKVEEMRVARVEARARAKAQAQAEVMEGVEKVAKEAERGVDTGRRIQPAP